MATQRMPYDQEILGAFGDQTLTPESLKSVFDTKLRDLGYHVQNEARGDYRPRLLSPTGETIDLGDYGKNPYLTNRGNMGDWHTNQGQNANNPAAGGGGGAGMGGIGQGINSYFNQGRIDQRVNSARDQLERYRKSRSASNRSELAGRGTLGSGPEMTAMNRADADIADRFANAVSDIYSNESAMADQLGLGYGRLGLDQDRLFGELSQGRTSQLMKILEMLQGGAGQSAGGYF